MAWTQYHDQLSQQAIALMTEPNWANNAALVTRLNDINTELTNASESLGQQQDQRMQDLLTQFQTAYDQGNAANESRYSELKQGYTDRTNNLQNNFYQPVASGYATALGQDATRNTNALGGLNQRITDLNAMHTGLGNQARQDVSNKYAGIRGQSDQDLTSRGLGNSTVRASAMAGINSQEAQDLSRVNDGLRREQIQNNTQWTDDYQKAQERYNVRQGDLSLQSLGYGERMAGAMGELTKEPLGVIERRTDTAPGLADIANMTLQLGRGSANTFALPAFGVGTSYNPNANLFGGVQ